MQTKTATMRINGIYMHDTSDMGELPQMQKWARKLADAGKTVTLRWEDAADVTAEREDWIRRLAAVKEELAAAKADDAACRWHPLPSSPAFNNANAQRVADAEAAISALYAI